MPLLIYALVFLAVGLIIAGFVGLRYASPPRIKLSQNEHINRIRTGRPLLSLILPFTGNLLERFGLARRIKQKLDAAHVKFSPEEFFNLKIILAAGLAAAVYFLLGRPGPGVLSVVFILGYIIPDIYIKRRISHRKAAIIRLLPETIDLLGLCVEAGLDFNTALRWVIEKTPPNPMLEELSFVLEEIKWGKVRIQALKDMAQRLNTPEIGSFVHTLAQAERMGTPVVEAFSILSEDSRNQRFHRGERLALQAPVKILVPLIFCILPAIAIIIAGPIMIQFMQGNLLKGIGQ